MNIILLGAPGCGKGTQAVFLAREFGLPHVSTGEYFRRIISEKTELGVIADRYIAKGFLVPDEIVVKIATDRLSMPDCRNGFILDGFPRTLMQAEELKKLYKIDHCIFIDVQTDLLITRIMGRRICSVCGKNFHVELHNNSSCEICGGQLKRRDDDVEETVRERLEVFASSTKQLIDFYRSEGNLRTVDGGQSIEDVSRAIKVSIMGGLNL